MASSPHTYRVPALIVVGVFIVVAIVGVTIYVLRAGTPEDAAGERPAREDSEVREPAGELEPLDDPQPEPDLRLAPEPRTQPTEEPDREPAPGPYPPPGTGGL
jgi:hypothetical protein